MEQYEAFLSKGNSTAPIPLAAQQGCEFVAPGNDISRTLTVGGLQITYITNPHFLCAGGVEIWADSAEAFPGRGYSHLIGNVRYVESVRELTAVMSSPKSLGAEARVAALEYR